MIRRRRETGYCIAYVRAADAGYSIHPDDYLALRTASMNGQAFVSLRGYSGGELIIKLATIEAITLQTPAAIQADREEAAADKADDAILGMGA